MDSYKLKMHYLNITENTYKMQQEDNTYYVNIISSESLKEYNIFSVLIKLFLICFNIMIRFYILH